MSLSEGGHLSLNLEGQHSQVAPMLVSKQSDFTVQLRPKVQPFEYTPLPTTSSIRLVRLRGKDRGTGLLQCSLDTVDLKVRPTYDVVSSQSGFPLPTKPHDSNRFNSDGPRHDELSPEDDFEPRVPILCNNRVLKVTRSIYKLLCRLQTSPNLDKRYRRYNKTALIWAAEQGRESAVRVLIRRGADLDCQDCFGNTALHYASENGHLEIVRTLVTAGARIDIHTLDHRTPLTCAEIAEHQDIIEYLLNVDKQRETIEKSNQGQIEPNDQLFWIDTICIDLNNIHERQSIESVSSELYECAQIAIVWLGDSDESTALAQGALASLASLFYIPAVPEDDFAAHAGGHSIFAQNNCPEFRIVEWHGLLQLFRRPWFKGYAVQHERLAHAPHCFVYCGMEVFLWDEIVHVADYFNRRQAEMLARSKDSEEHYLARCDHCSKERGPYIRGIRYKCAFCKNVDFCAPCLADEKNKHNPEHKMITIEQSRTHIGIPVMAYSFEAHLPWPFLRPEMRDMVGYPIFSKLPVSMSSEPSIPIPALSRSLRSSTLRHYEPYEYAQLPSSNPISTSIRLLKLWGFDSSGCMRISMETVTLESMPVYMAASYTWGNPMPEGSALAAAYSDEQSYPVLCDDRALFVNKNLHDFLCELMEPHELEPRDSRHGATPLHWAAMRGHLKTVRFHIQSGADIHSRNNDKSTPLHLAVLAGDHADIVQILLENGADVASLDVGENTPLHWAARCDRLEAAKLLVDAGSDVALHNSVGKSPLAIAQEYHPVTIGRFLEGLGNRSPCVINRKRPLPRIAEMFFWIDALCINQNDDVEKASQITIMSQIYGCASGTLVWFGLPDDSTETALKAISLIASQRVRYREIIIRWGITKAQQKDMIQLPEDIVQMATQEEGITARHFDALHTFLRRQWFSRAWILQEVSLANYVEMFCGPYQLLWRELFLVLEEMAPAVGFFGNGWPPKYFRAQKGAEPWILSLLRLRMHPELYFPPAEVVKRWPSRRPKLPLAVLVILSWTFSTSNPRDKIYALLGLAQELPDDQRVVVDYNVPVENLYTATARIMYHGSYGVDGMDDSYPQHLEELKESEILSFVEDSSLRSTPKLPSWVPEFDLKFRTWRIWMKSLYNCGGSLKNPMQSTSSASHLGLRCMHWDTVTAVEPEVYTFLDSDSPSVKFPLYSWLQFISKFDQLYITGQDRVEVLWRTLILDRSIPYWLQDTKDQLVTPAEPKESLRDSFFATVRKVVSERVSLDDDYVALLDSMAASDTSSSLPSTKDVEEWLQSDALEASRVAQHKAAVASSSVFHHTMPSAAPAGEVGWDIWYRLAYPNRRLFRTGKGYLGLGLKSLQEKDHVCILPGASVPFLLRKSSLGDNYYQLVGESYVHGIMQGEALQSGDSQFESIILV